MPGQNRRWRGAVTLLLSSMMAASWAQRAPSPDDPGAIVAETQQLSKRQGMVRIAGVTWKCSDRLCIATSKKAPTGVKTCQAIAEQVGYLTRFGRVQRPIPSYDLALCNVRAQIKLAKIEQERADAEAARQRRLPPRNSPVQPAAPPVASSPRVSPRAAPPPVIEASPIAPTYRPPVFALQVNTLTVVGRQMASETVPPLVEVDVDEAAEMPAAPPSGDGFRRIDVPALALVGRGRMQPMVPGTHLTVTVDKLNIVGQPPAPSKD